MKQTKFWSVLLAMILLVSCTAGIMIVGAEAESTTVYYTIGEVEQEGSEHFDTLAEAFTALKAKNKKWGANESVEIRFKGDIEGGTNNGLLFGLTTIWREDGTKLPIAFRGMDESASLSYIYLDAAGGWYAAANDYSFYHLTLPVGEQDTQFYAGSGNIYFEDVPFLEGNIKIKTSAEQAIEHRLMREIGRTVAARNQADIIPAGDAWFDLITNKPEIGNNLSWSLKKPRPQGDYKHDGDIGGGMYLNACVWYEILTKKSCIGHTWRPSEGYCDYVLDEALIDDLQEAAHKAVLDEYGEDYYDDAYTPDKNQDGTVNILNIGSSNGYYYVDELCQMLTADGYTARVCTAYHSGVKISTQWTWAEGTAAGDYQFRIYEANSATTNGIVAAEKSGVGFDHFETKYPWDSITFYQTSGSFIYSDFETNTQAKYNEALANCAKADDLYAYMRKTNPDARYTWYQVCPNPVGYPGASETPTADAGYFFADTCTDAVFSGWPELKEGEKVKTSITFGPNTTFYEKDGLVKFHVAAVGYLYDPSHEAFTDVTAAQLRYPTSADYPDIADIRPVDVSASIILDGGKLYDAVAKYGASPSDGTVHVKSGNITTVSGDLRTNSTTVVENYYGDIYVKVSGGTVAGSVYGMYNANVQGNLIMEISEDDGTTVVGDCLRGLFGSGEVTKNIEMTVKGGLVGPDGANNSFYGGGNAKGEVINTISGGTLVGAYYGVRSGQPGKVTNKFLGGKIIGNGASAYGHAYGAHYEGSKVLGDIVNVIDGTEIEGNFIADFRTISSTCSSVKNTFKSGSVGAYYGGGYGTVTGKIYNEITGGTVKGAFYGSCENKNVGNVETKISGSPVFNGVFYGFGADSSATVSENKTVTTTVSGGTFKKVAYLSGVVLRERTATVSITGGTFSTDCYCGAYKGAAKKIDATIKGGTFSGIMYGGNCNGDVNVNVGAVNVTIEGGTFNNSVFGANKGYTVGDVHVIVKGNPVFKGNFAPGSWNKTSGTLNGVALTEADTKTGNVTLEISGGTFAKYKYGTENNEKPEGIGIYPGSSGGTVGNVQTTVTGGTFNGVFYAGYGGNMGTLTTLVKAGTFKGIVYLGPWSSSSSSKDVYNTLTGGTFSTHVYLGGNGGSAGNIVNVLGDDKGGPNFDTKSTYLYCGGARSGKSVGNISNTFNSGTYRNVICGSADGAINGSVTNVFNGGRYINSVTCCGWSTNNGKVMTTVNGGQYDEYLIAGGRGQINLPAGSEDYYSLETVIYGGTFKGVWCGGEGGIIRKGNAKLTVYDGTFNNYSTSASRQSAIVAGGRGMRHNGNMDVFLYGGTYNGEIVAGAAPNSDEDTYAKPNPDCVSTVTIYGGTFNKPLLANSKWNRANCKKGTIILNPTESDIIINTTMAPRTACTGAQSYEIVGGDRKIILGADAEIEATSVSGDVKFGQGTAWAKRVYATLPEGNDAVVTVTGPHCLDRVGDSVVAVKGGVQLFGATMLLTDRVAVRALFDKASVEAIDDFTFNFKMNGETLASGSKADLVPYGEDYYCTVLAKIGANDFTKTVTFAGSEMVWENSFSVKGLAELAEDAWAGNEVDVQLAKAMQNFAAIVAGESLPYGDLQPDLTKLDGFKATASKEDGTAFTVTAKGLVMGNAVGIRIYGTSAEAITADSFVIKVNGKDVTEKAIVSAGAKAGEYTVDLYVNAKNMSDPLNLVIAEKASGKVCLNLTDRVDAIAASYGENHENYAKAQQLLVYIQAAVAYAGK